jgi:hypothetical protein
VRTLLGGLLALACALTVLVVGTTSGPATPVLEPAADLSQFDPGNIITDAVFHDSGAMTTAQIQSFLDAKGANCRASASGPACLKDYVQTTSTRAADALCPGKYVGARESAAAIIKKVAVACTISPRVLLVTLQKEMGFITSSGPTHKMYTRAMGMGCPDNTGGTCDSQYNGFFNQLYSASKQFQRYAANPTRYAHVPHMWNNVRYSPVSSCGSGRVFIENQATASLYNYTPYQPNKAALDAGYGTGNSCSAYGNRNFFSYFTDWFGSTRSGGRDADAPVGRLETVADRGDSVRVRGWAFDPNSPTSPVTVSVYADGKKIGTDTTDVARPDVAGANHGAGDRQGFDATFTLARGKHTVCVYPFNIGAGYSNPRLGCAIVTVTAPASWNPKGRVADVRVAGTRVVVEGWSFDPDSPRSANTVRVWADGLRLGDVVADDDRPDVAKYYPSAGAAHGFRLSSRLTKGTHRVCVYALNKGLGTANPGLGCRSVTVTAPPLVAPITTGAPVGRVATVEVDGQDVRLTGWAFDPDAPAKAATVQVFAGSKLVAQRVANGDLPDVARYFPYAGSAHAFTVRGIAPHGQYDLCVRAVNVGAGRLATLGCKAVTVAGDPKANPVSRLASVTVSGTKVSATGWSYDPDRPASPVTVRFYADGKRLADVVADGNWPSLVKYRPAAETNAHGFTYSATLSPGSHQICAWAINVVYGTTNPFLGCRQVSVLGGVSVDEPEVVDPPVTEAPQSTESTPTATATATATGTATATSEAPATSEDADPTVDSTAVPTDAPDGGTGEETP